MKHRLGGGLVVVWEEAEDDDDVVACDVVETVCVETENCVCVWALLNPGLLAETKTGY